LLIAYQREPNRSPVGFTHPICPSRERRRPIRFDLPKLISYAFPLNKS
jgi:hypothetical protein